MALSADASEFRPGAQRHLLRRDEAPSSFARAWRRVFDPRGLLAAFLGAFCRRPG